MSQPLMVLAGALLLSVAVFLLWQRSRKRPIVKSTHPLRDVKNVYVIRTHLWNDYVKGVFQKMQDQLGAENVFLMFDETKAPIEQPHVKWNDPAGVNNGPAIITVNEEDCARINELHMAGERTGSVNRVEAQICACYKAIRKEYDYLWFIEFDVYCNDYKEALRPYDQVVADMLTKGTANPKQQKARSVKTDKGWFWWPMLMGEISKVPLKDRRGCFFPINRFSKKFLEVLEANLSKSSGYCEVYFPTLCVANGLVLETMSLQSFGTFRYRPAITPEEFNKIRATDTKLYHPVKELQPSVIVSTANQQAVIEKA